MKYFKINGQNFHCDNIFNYCRIDLNGHVMLYQNKPFVRSGQYYWTSGHTDSHDLTIYDPDSPIKSLFNIGIKAPFHDWYSTIIEVK